MSGCVLFDATERPDDLLNSARIEAGRFTLEIRSVNCRTLVEEAVHAVSPLAEAQRITLVMLVDPVMVEVDPGDDACARSRRLVRPRPQH